MTTLRHAAALTLVGWYLMVPPAISQTEVDSKAPLHSWEILSSFDSAEACEETVVDMQKNTGKAGPEEEAIKRELGTRYDPAIGRARVRYAQCIATDDPRLKEK